ncbi:antitoxin [Pararhizobium sp.]|uniref:antitoxin n=1 Tax=Pararhizobium sp. TaxID=1977563 RepID=UPI0027165B11|nr:type II toxin-antitoxin system VapB family antitoxin [Pararhizobium sp.]MDO9416047.1 type II toxin-antitoxin system VapB family antitoxin [Pararhizobium sp.]
MAKIAKVFRSGNSQAIRLPKAFQVDVSEMDISRDGDALILRPRARRADPWSNVKKAVALGFSGDFFEDGREQPALPDRHNMDGLFK